MEPAPRTAGWWEGYPWRLVQTNLRETDMRDIDAARYVESLLDLNATVAMVNTSGIIASYPTALPFHTQNAFLQGDGLESIVAACHENGIRVIARTDFSKVRPELHERHPEWATMTADGGIVEDEGDVHVCPSGGYQQDCAPKIVEETITLLDVDGIFFNMAGFQTSDYRGVDHGICHCASCVNGFREMFDLALPVNTDLDDVVFRRYLVFQDRVLRDSKRRMDALIRRVRPDLAIDRPSDDAGGFVRQESNTVLDRAMPEWPYRASANTKWVVSSLPRTVSSNSSVDFIDYPVRHVSVSPDRQRLRLAQTLANGGGLDYYVIGRLDRRHDRSGLAGVREMFGFHAAHDQEYRDLRSCASIGLLTGPHGEAEEFRGWFRVLTEHHFLFDVLLIEATTEPVLERYDALVLPGLEPIGDDVARRLDRFVESGGTLVASGRPGFRTAELDPRDEPALTCLGIERALRDRDVRGAYLEIVDHSEFPRLADTSLVYLDGSYLDAEYRAGAQHLLRLIPPGPFGPPERCVLPEPTGQPGLVLHAFGSGRAVNVPWSCGSLVDRHGHPNTSSFLADVLQQHAGLDPVGGTLPPSVEVTLLEHAGAGVHLLHLVNGSGHRGIGCDAPVTMRELDVVVPYEGEPSSVTGLVGGRDLEWHVADGKLTVHVPELGLFEAVRIAKHHVSGRSGT
jgi:hypothetical protein